MKRRFLTSILSLVVLSSSLWGVTLKDSLGRAVEIKEPKRVAALTASLAELWQVSGGDVAITVGESVNLGYVDSSVVLVDKGSGMSINSELLLASRPDLVLLSGTLSSHLRLQGILEAAGIPAFYLSVEDFDDYMAVLEPFSGVNGDEEAFGKYGLSVLEDIERIVAKAKEIEYSPRVLYIRAGSGFSSTKAKSSDDTFAGAIIRDLGATNIADGTKLPESLSLEAIVERNPEYILISTQGDEDAAKAYVETLFSSPGWRDLMAVKENQYIFLDKSLFHLKPYRNWNESYRKMFEILYPGVEL